MDKTDSESETHPSEKRLRLPPGQQLVGADKWPIVGERESLPTSGEWQLEIAGCVHQPLKFNLAELQALPATTIELDIHCVTRWSKYDVTFEGVTLRQLCDLAQPAQDARFVSFVANTERQHSTSLTLDDALTHDTLIAWSTNGTPLPAQHGGPLRSVVPRKYFYKSVKWLHRIELLQEDRLGYWEAETGYHNHADPWREERFMAPNIDRRTAAKLMESKSFAGWDLRSLNASKMDLAGLDAKSALLRNADFRDSLLSDADFEGANLSNAKFRNANLQNANFVNADLEGADFSGADLRNANLTDASLFGASFCVATEDSGESASISHPAILDQSTQIHPNQLENLTETQFRFVRHKLGLSD